MNKLGDRTMDNQQLEVEMRDITGYEGKYMITRDGRVYNCQRKRFLKPKTTRF
jgi:hypothetical protein